MGTRVRKENADRPLSEAQRMKIFAVARELGIDNGRLHTLVMDVTGQESIRALTRKEAADIIDGLVSLRASGRRQPFAGPAPTADAPNVIRLATQAQLDMVKDLAKSLGLEADDPYFRGIVARATGRHGRRVKIITPDHASRVIEALKVICKRQEKEGQDGPHGEFGPDRGA